MESAKVNPAVVTQGADHHDSSTRESNSSPSSLSPESLASLIEEAEKAVVFLAQRARQSVYGTTGHAWLASSDINKAEEKARALLDHLIAGAGRREKDQDVHTRMDSTKPSAQHIDAGKDRITPATVFDNQVSNDYLRPGDVAAEHVRILRRLGASQKVIDVAEQVRDEWAKGKSTR